MTWFRVDDNLAMHPKAIAAGNAALGLWVRAGSWCGQQLTDGFVPDAVAASLGTKAQARALVDAGLWARVDGGWQFHEWHERQPTRDAVETERAAARERMANRRRSSPDVRANTTTNDDRTSGDVRLPRPVPSRPSTDSHPVVVSPPVPPTEDDDIVTRVAKARAARLGRLQPAPKWLDAVVASMRRDEPRILELDRRGFTPDQIDRDLDGSPAAPEPRPGPALPGTWEPAHVPDAVDLTEAAARVRELRTRTA